MMSSWIVTMEGIYNTSNHVMAPSKQPYEGHSEIIDIPVPNKVCAISPEWCSSGSDQLE